MELQAKFLLLIFVNDTFLRLFFFCYINLMGWHQGEIEIRFRSFSWSILCCNEIISLSSRILFFYKNLALQKSLSLMFAWQIPFTFPGLLLCLHYWVMLTVINNKYSTLRLDIEGCWNEVAPSSCWTNFVLYDLCVLLYCVNVMLFQRRFITETYIKGSIKKCKAATSSFS